jgi:deazaflavin-dependent oxidoreductase (nitroreductase family)
MAHMAAGTRMRFLRPFTTRLFNPIARRFAGRLPGFGILTYVGRKSGRVYHTPLNVFRKGDHYLFALTYGAQVDWVKNVLAAGGASLRTGGREIRLVEPQVLEDPSMSQFPLPVRVVLRFDRATEMLRMRASSGRA